MPNVEGQWIEKPTIWRKISLNTWSPPDNATIFGLLDVDVGRLQDFLKARSEASGVKCTMTHAVARALALVLHKYPECNVLVRGRRLWQRKDVDIFHQVAMPIEGRPGKADLSGATIRKADTKRIEVIARELKEAADAVRRQKDGEMARTRNLMMDLPDFVLTPLMKILGFLSYDLNLSLPTVPDDPFGSAMVTSVGMLGIKMAYAPLVTFTRCPIILLVGAIEDRPVVRDGQVVIRPMCSLTASLDHRILDGFLGGLLASEMQRLLEEPELLDSGS